MPEQICYNVSTQSLYELVKSTFHRHLLLTLARWAQVREGHGRPNAPLLLALVLYGEARGESEKGQRAIVDVIVNRARKTSTKNIDDIILAPFQFSSLNDGDKSLDGADVLDPKLISHWLSFAQSALDQTYAGTWDPVVPSATLFCTEDALQHQLRQWIYDKKPFWDFTKLQRVAFIGRHIFFKEV